jgi:prolipoprotein diacylglyceryltransferase
MKLTSPSSEFKMIIIGYYQICGGVLGLLFVIWSLIHQPTMSGFSFLIYLLVGSLFSFSIYAGNLTRKEEIKGLYLTQWNQILQIFQFSVSAYGFSYISGVFFNFGFDWTNIIQLKIDFGYSGWFIGYTPDDTDHFSIFLNFMPFVILYFLGKIANDIEERKLLIEKAKRLSEEK